MRHYIHNRERSKQSEGYATAAALFGFLWVFALAILAFNVFEVAGYRDPAELYISLFLFSAAFWIGVVVIVALVFGYYATRGRVIVTEHEGEPGELQDDWQEKAKARVEASKRVEGRRAPALGN